MTNAIFHGWAIFPDRSIKTTSWDMEDIHTSSKESECIPDWAALAVALGIVLAVAGFVSACFTDKGWATLLLTGGLIVAAIGMHSAENAVNPKPDWQPLPNG